MNKIKAKLSGKKEVARSLTRIAHEIIEKNDNLGEIAIVGIRTRGDFLAKRLHAQIEKISGIKIPIGALDVTFHRDDFRTNLGSPKVGASQILFEVEGRNIILIDDVLLELRPVLPKVIRRRGQRHDAHVQEIRRPSHHSVAGMSPM